MKAMNDTLRNTVAIVMMLLLPVLFGTAQAGFQSTSAYSGQWSEQATPLLNGDGSVNHEAYMSGSIGPRKNTTGNPGTPSDKDEEEEEQQPLGDALLPLMLIACAYLIVCVTRRRTTIEP